MQHSRPITEDPRTEHRGPAPGARAAGPGPTLSRTAIADRYILERVVNRSQSGFTWVALDAKTPSRRVAIRIGSERFTAWIGDPHAYASRVLLLRDMPFPGLPCIEDAGVFDGRPFMAFEWQEHEPLDQFLANLAPNDPRDFALPAVLELARAVAELHAVGLLHLDLKCSGIAYDRERGRFRLIDWGHALPIAPLNGPQPPFPGLSIDAVPYASTELLSGESPDPRDDVFALGAIAYELVRGAHPFGRRSARDAALLNLSPSPISRLNTEQNDVLARALTLDRSLRSITPGEVAAAFESAEIEPPPLPGTEPIDEFAHDAIDEPIDDAVAQAVESAPERGEQSRAQMRDDFKPAEFSRWLDREMAFANAPLFRDEATRGDEPARGDEAVAGDPGAPRFDWNDRGHQEFGLTPRRSKRRQMARALAFTLGGVALGFVIAKFVPGLLDTAPSLSTSTPVPAASSPSAPGAVTPADVTAASKDAGAAGAAAAQQAAGSATEGRSRPGDASVAKASAPDLAAARPREPGAGVAAKTEAASVKPAAKAEARAPAANRAEGAREAIATAPGAVPAAPRAGPTAGGASPTAPSAVPTAPSAVPTAPSAVPTAPSGVPMGSVRPQPTAPAQERGTPPARAAALPAVAAEARPVEDGPGGVSLEQARLATQRLIERSSALGGPPSTAPPVAPRPGGAVPGAPLAPAGAAPADGPVDASKVDLSAAQAATAALTDRVATAARSGGTAAANRESSAALAAHCTNCTCESIRNKHQTTPELMRPEDVAFYEVRCQK